MSTGLEGKIEGIRSMQWVPYLDVVSHFMAKKRRFLRGYMP
jgi:hypothetical protein